MMQFYYFNFRTWRGDVPRILMHLANLSWKDHSLTPEQFGELREAGKFPFGFVPVLITEDGLVLTQAVAIIKYLGIRTGYYPADPGKAAKVDEPILMVEEITTLVSPTSEMPVQKRKVARQKFVDTVIASTSANLDALIGDKKFITGDELTVGDLVVWNLYKWFESGAMEYISGNLADNYGNLDRVIKNVDSHPGVAQWVSQQKFGKIKL